MSLPNSHVPSPSTHVSLRDPFPLTYPFPFYLSPLLPLRLLPSNSHDSSPSLHIPSPPLPLPSHSHPPPTLMSLLTFTYPFRTHTSTAPPHPHHCTYTLFSKHSTPKLLEVVAAEILEVEQNWNQVYWEYFWFSIFFIGVLASRMWLAWIGVGLLLLIYKGPRVAEKAWLPLMFSAWG